MKIIQLTAENVKKISAVEIIPTGNLVQITGKNGQGKTAVLDSIWWALGGTEGIQSQPIRKGHERARIELKLGEGDTVTHIVERRITPKGSTLEIKNAEGLRYPSPQKLLDEVLGKLTFDPLGFMREDEKRQFAILRQLVGVDFTALDTKQKKESDDRTLVGRDLKTAQSVAQTIAVPEGLPDAAPDIDAVMARLTGIDEYNSYIRDLRSRAAKADERVATAERNISDIDNEIAECLAQIECAKERIEKNKTVLSTAREDAAKAHKSAEQAGDLQDAAAIRDELKAAQTICAGIGRRDQKAAADVKAAGLKVTYDAHTKAIEDIDAAKQTMIAEAKMPVEGLSFADDQVWFNGLPLNQASDAEQLMVSTAIAAALNPKLRVLRIRDGSLLDDDAVNRLAEFANTRDFQIWVERVDGSGAVGIVMEDGHVKVQDEAA